MRKDGSVYFFGAPLGDWLTLNREKMNEEG